MPPAATVALGLMVAGGLVLVFPYRGLEEQLTSNLHTPDALQLAYTQAWLNTRPHQPSLRQLFAQQLIAAGQLNSARRELAALRSSDDPRIRQRALLIELDLEMAEIERLPPNSEQRREQLEALQERLHQMALRTDTDPDEQLLQLTPTMELELAQRATAAGARLAARLWYQRLLVRGAPLAAGQWEEAARQLLALGEAEAAARLYFAAQAASVRVADQRRYYLMGLRTLQNAGLFHRALLYAEQGLDTWRDDIEVLEFLTRLALAANRPDLAQRFAIRLLKISLLPQAIAQRLAQGQPVPEHWWQQLAHRSAYAQTTQFSPQATDPADTQIIDPRQPHLPFNDRLYTLSYEVFLANNNLKDALLVAQSAVRQMPGSRTWRLRLAQVADWSAQPTLALEQWHALARASNSAQDWAEVERRAPQLFDTARWIEALEFSHRRKPGDLALLRTLVSAYEQQGEPERAITLLQQPGDPGTRQPRLELLAQVAQRAGRDALARTTLQTLMREFPGDVIQVTTLARLEFSRGDPAAAFAVLTRHLQSSKAPPADTPADTPAGYDFWDTYAELALMLGHKDAALRAYEVILASPPTDPVAHRNDLTRYAALLETTTPLKAVPIYERAHQQFGDTYFAVQAFYLQDRYGTPEQTRALLQRLVQRSPTLEADANFLAQRASFWLRVGDHAAAIRDARRALARIPQQHDTRATLIWALIASLADNPAVASPSGASELRTTLLASSAIARNEPTLWDALAAGWMSLQEPRYALPWLTRVAEGAQKGVQTRTRRNNPLWLMSAAQAYSQLGQPEVAWQLQRRAWLLLREARPTNADSDHTLLSLATTFEPGEVAQWRMKKLLAAKQSAQRNEALLGYWLAREHSEVAQAWLVNRYAHAWKAPAWAELSIALAQGDQPRLTTLLDGPADRLPIADHIEAAQRTGRYTTAQTLAFDAAQRFAQSDALHERAADQLLSAAPWVGGGVSHFSQDPLRETTTQLTGSIPLTPRWALRVQAEQTDRHITDTSALTSDLPRDQTQLIAARYAPGADSMLELSAHQRSGFATTTGLLLEAQRQVAPRLRLGGSLGWAQRATDSIYTRVGAVRDFAQLQATVRLSQRESADLEFTRNRYVVQGGEALGNGSTLHLTLRHALRLENPDLNVHVGAAQLRYHPDAGLNTSLLPLLAPDLRPPLATNVTNATWLPASTHQLSAGLACGQSTRLRPGHRWRAFCSFTLTDDANSGTQSEWQLGAHGSVLGSDDLDLSVTGGSATNGQGASFTLWSLKYRWYY